METNTPNKTKKNNRQKYHKIVQKYAVDSQLREKDLTQEELRILELMQVTSTQFIEYIELVRQFVNNPNRDEELSEAEEKIIQQAKMYRTDLMQQEKEARLAIDEATMPERQEARIQNKEEFDELNSLYFQELKNMITPKLIKDPNTGKEVRTSLPYDKAKECEFGENGEKCIEFRGRSINLLTELAKYTDYYPRIIDDYSVLYRLYTEKQRKSGKEGKSASAINIKAVIEAGDVSAEEFFAARDAANEEFAALSKRVNGGEK